MIRSRPLLAKAYEYRAISPHATLPRSGFVLVGGCRLHAARDGERLLPTNLGHSNASMGMSAHAGTRHLSFLKRLGSYAEKPDISGSDRGP